MQGGTVGLTAPSVLLLVGAGLVTGAILVVTSLRKQYPLIQFRLLQIRNVAIAVVVSFLRFLPNVLMGAFVARYVQQVLGLSPTVTGLFMILPVLAQVFAAPIAGRMLDKDGPRVPVSLGAGLMVVGLIFLALGFPAQNIWLVLIGTIVGGAGFAFMNPVQMAALSQTPLEQRGMLAGIFPLAGQFGTALFVALLTAGLKMLMNKFLAANPAQVKPPRRRARSALCVDRRSGDGGDVDRVVVVTQCVDSNTCTADTSGAASDGQIRSHDVSDLIELPRIEDFQTDYTAEQIHAAELRNIRAIAMQAYLQAFPAFLHLRQLTEFIQGRKYFAPDECPLGGWVLMRELATPKTTTVSPNVDTLYGASYLLLNEQGPIVLSVPPIPDRYYSVAILDAYFNNFAIVSPRTFGNAGGNYLLMPPGWKTCSGWHPRGFRRAHSGRLFVAAHFYAQSRRIRNAARAAGRDSPDAARRWR